MKRTTSLFLFVLLTLSLYGCATDNAAVTEAPTETPQMIQTESSPNNTANDAEDFYGVCTYYSKAQVEAFAQEIREYILAEDWQSLSEHVSYPISIGSYSYDDKASFAKGEFADVLTPQFYDAVKNEDCTDMFCNWQGIMFGNGEVWIAEVNGLKVTAVNVPPAEPTLPQAATWQEAYLQIIWNLPDYLADVFMSEGYRENPEFYDRENISVYLGIHDFDEDGTPELIAGDGYALAVFTFTDGQAEKLADLYYPGTIWCVNGVQFRDHSVSVTCSGSDGSDFVQFGYLDGEYKLGLYSQYHDPHDVFINGEISTLEEMNRIYPLDWNQRADSELKWHRPLVYEDGVWVLKSYFSDEEMILDGIFDFDLIKWE